MTTPSTWHEHARHYLHREQRRPCRDCPFPAYDAVDANDALLPTQPYCQQEPPDGGTLCELPNGHIGDHRFDRQHDPDCILYCTRQLDGEKCRILHGCWCVFTPEDVEAW